MSAAEVAARLFTGDRLAGAVLMLMAAVVVWESRVLPLGTLLTPGPAFMPIALAAVVFVCGVLLVLIGSGTGQINLEVDWRRVPAILGAAAFAAWALERLGYRLTMLAVLLFTIGIVERRNVVATVLFAAAIAFGSFFVFDTLLRTPLPRGPFGL